MVLSYSGLLEDISSLAEKHGRHSDEITLIAVSKTQPIEAIKQLYDQGCRAFGENRMQEFLEKHPQLPEDIDWHLIGTLQSKKVNKAIGKFTLIHSVDSPSLASKISSASARDGIVTPILLQVNTSLEESKHGLSIEEWRRKIEQVVDLPNIRIDGLMTIGPLTDNEKAVHKSFADLRLFLEELSPFRSNKAPLHHLSMGMSGDYPIAIAEGATLLRVGSTLFGKRS